MIPHVLAGSMYTWKMRLAPPASFHGELRQLSTFDEFRDAFNWIEGGEFRYALVPVSWRGKRVDVTVYINVDEEKTIEDCSEKIRQDIARELRVRGKGFRIASMGTPKLLLRLDSVERRIAEEEETRSEKIFSELIDS